MVRGERKQRRYRNQTKKKLMDRGSVDHGGTKKPGQIEGDNTDPVLVRGEDRVRQNMKIPPNLTIRAIAAKKNADEYLLITDNPNCFPYTKQIPHGSQYESKLYFLNSENPVDPLTTMTNRFSLLDDELPQDYVANHFKFNDAAWRPQPASSIARENTMDDLDTENTKNDLCVLVGETRYEPEGEDEDFPGPGTLSNIPAWQVAFFFPYRCINQSMYQENTGSQTRPDPPLEKIQNFPLTIYGTDGNESSNFDDRITFFGIDAYDRNYPKASVIEPFIKSRFVIVGYKETDNGFKIPIAYEMYVSYKFSMNVDINLNAGFTDVYDPLPFSNISIVCYQIPIPVNNYSEILYDCSVNSLTDEVLIVGQALEDEKIHPVYKYNLETRDLVDFSVDAGVYSTERFSEVAYLIQSHTKNSLFFPNSDLTGLQHTSSISDDLRSGQRIIVDDFTPQRDIDTRGYGDNISGIFSLKSIKPYELVINERVPSYKPCIIPWGWIMYDDEDDTELESDQISFNIIVPTRAENNQFDFFPEDGPEYIYIEGSDGRWEIMSYETCTYIGQEPPDGTPPMTAYPHAAPAQPMIDCREYELSGIQRGLMGTTPIEIPYFSSYSPLATFIQRLVPLTVSSHSRYKNCEWNPNQAVATFTGENGIFKHLMNSNETIHNVDQDENISQTVDIGPIAYRHDGKTSIIGEISNSDIKLIRYANNTRRVITPLFASINTIAYDKRSLSAMLGSTGLFEYNEFLNVDYDKVNYVTTIERTLLRDVQLSDHNWEMNSYTNQTVYSGAIPIGDMDFNSITLFSKLEYIKDRIDNGLYPCPQPPYDQTDQGIAIVPAIKFWVEIYIYIVPISPRHVNRRFGFGSETPEGAIYKKQGYYCGKIRHNDINTISTTGESHSWSHITNADKCIWVTKKAFKIPGLEGAYNSNISNTRSNFARYLFIGAMNFKEFPPEWPPAWYDEDTLPRAWTEYEPIITVTLQGQKLPE